MGFQICNFRAYFGLEIVQLSRNFAFLKVKCKSEILNCKSLC